MALLSGSTVCLKIKNEVIEEARTQYPAMKQKYEKRKLELKEAKYQEMLMKQQEQKDVEDRQSVKKMNACNALVDNNINAWISCEQATGNLEDISVERRAAVVLAQTFTGV